MQMVKRGFSQNCWLSHISLMAEKIKGFEHAIVTWFGRLHTTLRMILRAHRLVVFLHSKNQRFVAVKMHIIWTLFILSLGLEL